MSEYQNAWVSQPNVSGIGLDLVTVQAVQRIGGKRPAYGTRRMAVHMCRETRTVINRKKI